MPLISAEGLSWPAICAAGFAASRLAKEVRIIDTIRLKNLGPVCLLPCHGRKRKNKAAVSLTASARNVFQKCKSVCRLFKGSRWKLNLLIEFTKSIGWSVNCFRGFESGHLRFLVINHGRSDLIERVIKGNRRRAFFCEVIYDIRGFEIPIL